jgi:histidyl-tRNA synthetase
MDLSLPRGIRDIEPEEYELHQRIRTAFEEIAATYNFRSMEPAPLETLSILRAKSGSQIDEGIYHFRDKANREIGLRFDLTVGMTRYVVAKKGMKPPVKLASFGGVWRYDEPQHARYRWFYQWDIEIFGDQTVDSDAEVMDLSYNLFRKLGLSKVKLHVGDRRVVEAYIKDVLKVESEQKRLEMMRALDKVDKKTEDELIEEYESKGVAPAEMMQLLEFGRTQGDPEGVLKRLSEERGLESLGLQDLRDTLKMRGITNVVYDLSIVRGIDYYTGIVFEVKDGERPDLGSLCGGGRYDALPRILGRPDLAATGAAGGVERIALSLSEPKKSQKQNGGSTGEDQEGGRSVYVAYTEPTLAGEAARILAQVRETGVRSDIGLRSKGLRKQLEDAGSMDFRWVVIVGRREMDADQVLLKDLRDGNEKTLSRGSLLGELAAQTSNFELP